MKTPDGPRPSSSIILISLTNQVLLLHRVQTSSAFPSAHVFPGGNLSAWQDGEIPAPGDHARHQDSLPYRRAAIRECFEESGILLARRRDRPEELLLLTDKERRQGRQMVHDDEVRFSQWVMEKGGMIDADGLIPFTRWVTPANIPKRFTTQMYLYFLPLPSSNPSREDPEEDSTAIPSSAIIHKPTPDGGREHTSARFLPPSKWLSMARAGEIILFPPQFFLLHLLTPFLSPENIPNVLDVAQLEQQRTLVKDFVKSGEPSWMDRCMSPIALGDRLPDGRIALGLDRPGRELEGSGRRGDEERVVLVNFRKEGPRELEVAWKRDVLREIRERGKL